MLEVNGTSFATRSEAPVRKLAPSRSAAKAWRGAARNVPPCPGRLITVGFCPTAVPAAGITLETFGREIPKV